MRIKPSLVTGAASALALAAVAIIVIATDPGHAQPELVALLWGALFIVTWGFLCTLLLLARQSMAQSLWAALPPAMAAIALLMLLQRGMLGLRLLEVVLSATLVLSVIVWWKFRTKPDHERHASEH
jgi:hypothetical protein